jgi:hypothetical protein
MPELSDRRRAIPAGTTAEEAQSFGRAGRPADGRWRMMVYGGTRKRIGSNVIQRLDNWHYGEKGPTISAPTTFNKVLKVKQHLFLISVYG